MPPALAKKLAPADPTFYLVDDGMGEGLLHREIAEFLRLLLQRFLDQQSKVARVGANQFIYWAQGNPDKAIASDVYVLPGVTTEEDIECWKVWERGIVPSFALEVASKSLKKDYVEVIADYAELGVPEVIVFDPKAGRPRSKRVRWQVYRRLKGRGLIRVEVSNEDRVYSKQLRGWLRAVGRGTALRVRLATGPRGDELFPSAEEAEKALTEAERARAQKAEAAAALERARAQEAEAKIQEAEAAAAAERARAQQAEAEIARIKAELEALRQRLSPPVGKTARKRP